MGIAILCRVSDTGNIRQFWMITLIQKKSIKITRGLESGRAGHGLLTKPFKNSVNFICAGQAIIRRTDQFAPIKQRRFWSKSGFNTLELDEKQAKSSFKTKTESISLQKEFDLIYC